MSGLHFTPNLQGCSEITTGLLDFLGKGLEWVMVILFDELMKRDPE